MFKKNLNTSGRILRFVIAFIFLVLAIWQWGWQSSWLWGCIDLMVAIFVFFEAMKSWCVVYHLFGINHCLIDKGSPPIPPSSSDRRE